MIRSFPTAVMRSLFALFAFSIMFLPHSGYAAGTLSLSKRALFEKGANVPQAVKDECGLETKLIEFVQKFADKSYDKIVLVDNASAKTPGSALNIMIVGAQAPKGGTTTGYKSLTIKGTLWRGGKVAGTFTAKRVTSGGVSFIGYKGTCSMLGRCAKALGKDVAAWLNKPSMNAKLGDAK